MTRAQPRASHDNDSLVRFLTENALLTPARPGEGVGQKLGDWLDFRQAIALHGVLNPEHPERTHGQTAAHPPESAPVHLPTRSLTPSLTPSLTRSLTRSPALSSAHAPGLLSPPARRSALIAPDALARHVDKVRAQLAESIGQGAPVGSGLARIDMPALSGGEAPEPKTAFAPYRRFVAAHQRQMESTLRSLRALLRQQLSQRGGHGQQLAALDAAFESILAEREATLLMQTTKLLEKRFVQTLKAQLQAPAQLQVMAQVNPLTLHQNLRQTLRLALLAELDTRLQPTLGLLEALTALTALTPQEP